MLIPNNKQNTKLFRYANTARFAYNWALGREKENYKNGGKFLSDSDLSNNVTKQAIKDACTAYKNFFKGLQKFPRFKSKKRSMPKFYQDNIKIQLRYNSAILMLSLKDFLRAGKEINKN